MDGTLEPIFSYAKSLGWRGRILSAFGFVLATEAAYELYLIVQEKIRKRKSMEQICEVRFMNRINVADCSENLSDMKMANVSYLVSYIDRAQESICLSMYIFTLLDVRLALLRARKERNVTVRVVCCESMVYNEGSQIRHLDEDCFVRFKVNSEYLMHHKFCLLDTDWLCAECLVKEHRQLVGTIRKDMQFTLFDRALIDDMAGLKKAFGSSCAVCDHGKRKKSPNSVSNPLPKGGMLITGSSNWTVPAFTVHWDNMIFTSIPSMVRPFAVEFQRQWYELSDCEKHC
ncbi:AGAP006233-PA-like protein [Anopheles sinensis]|uniref:Mitochondrial cardiolipin hydrolase n=1 Tax=Anopheles sinensis TaxID=74873 RepID=A0A084WK52_ANOSI|nr:AGAP006233-PA-like protein [Anopheles sinensis]